MNGSPPCLTCTAYQVIFQANGYPANGNGAQKAEFLEECLKEDINEPNFIPYLMVYEFEALLFVNPQSFAAWTDKKDTINKLADIAQAHETPEDINDGPQSAPSKRILSIMAEYQKRWHGPLIAMETGIDSLRHACPHFHHWLQRLEQLRKEDQDKTR